MYIEKLSEKGLPKENQKTRGKADLNTGLLIFFWNILRNSVKF